MNQEQPVQGRPPCFRFLRIFICGLDQPTKKSITSKTVRDSVGCSVRNAMSNKRSCALPIGVLIMRRIEIQ